MIAANQPDFFPSDLLVYVSAKSDGTVLDRSIGTHDGLIVSNRTRLCNEIGIDYGSVVFQRIIYSHEATYGLLAEVDERSTTKHTSEVVADGLFTKTPGVGLLLPIADCIGTVIYDPVRRYLALLHLGRHSTLTDLITKTIKHFEMQGSEPGDLLIWMSPSAQKQSYRLEYFDHESDESWQGFFKQKSDGYYLDMQGYNKMKCMNAGVPEENIHVSPVDTVTSEDYFSHSAGDTQGRFAVIAMMR